MQFFRKFFVSYLSIFNQYEPGSVCADRSNGTQREIFRQMLYIVSQLNMIMQIGHIVGGT